MIATPNCASELAGMASIRKARNNKRILRILKHPAGSSFGCPVLPCCCGLRGSNGDATRQAFHGCTAKTEHKSSLSRIPLLLSLLNRLFSGGTASHQKSGASPSSGPAPRITKLVAAPVTPDSYIATLNRRLLYCKLPVVTFTVLPMASPDSMAGLGLTWPGGSGRWGLSATIGKVFDSRQGSTTERNP